MQPFECTGLWWLPNQQSARVAGTLKVSSSGNLQLALVGALGETEGLAVTKSHSLILGTVASSPLGNNITLTGSGQTGRSFGAPGLHREEYHASRGFFGAHLLNDADFLFTDLNLRISGLTEWGEALSGLKQQPYSGVGVGKTISLVGYSMPAPIASALPGGTATLGYGLHQNWSRHEIVFREEAQLGVHCESPKTADELNATYVYPFQNLMTFVCDQPQEIQEFSVSREATAFGSAAAPWIHVVGPRVQPADDDNPRSSIHAFQMLFTVADTDFAVLATGWMRLMERFGDACSIFFGLQYGPPAYLDVTFLTVVQAINLFDARTDKGIARRMHEETRLKTVMSSLSPDDAGWIVDHVGIRPLPPFETVLRNLVQEHSNVMDPLVSKRPDRFVNEVCNTVHYIVRRDADVRLAASYGADLYWLVQKLRFLLKSCFLSELGFSADKIAGFFGRNSLYQHLCGLESAQEAKRQVR